MKKDKKIQATDLRNALITMVIAIIIVSSAGFYYAQSKLNIFAILVGQTIAESTADKGNTQSTKKIQENIAAVQPTVDKIDTLTVPAQDYQNQMVKDVNKYAANAGISITDYSFGSSKVESTGALGTNNSSSITITLSNPVQFTKLIKFLKSIETNMPKMQLLGISITPNQSDSKSVIIEPLTIKAYTR